MAARRDAARRNAPKSSRQRVSWNSVIYEKDLDSLARFGLLRVRVRQEEAKTGGGG